MANNAVFKYLKEQNRPYSANDIVQNLHKEYGKTAVQKALDQLASEQKIIEKTYGKQKVYCIMQNKESSDIEKMNADIQNIDQNNQDLIEKLKSIDEQIKNKENELRKYNSTLKTEEALEKKEELIETIKVLSEKLDKLENSNGPVISNEDKEKILREHEKLVREYKKRKRICTEILDSIMENYPKSKKVLIEEVGIETDEDAGFSLKI